MQIERFIAILDAYGGDDRRWPEAERESALALLAASPEACAAREDALAFDGLLDALPAEAVPAGLHEAVLTGAPRASRRMSLLDLIWPGAPLWRPAMAFAASIALGIAVGIGVLDLPAFDGSGGDTLIADDIVSTWGLDDAAGGG